jgi:hypothetical protein
MKDSQTGSRQDQKVNVKVVLSGLWVSMLFVFAYVDIFGFWRADVINGALDGEVPGAGFDIDQTFLTLTTLYILVPSLMVAFSLMAPVRFNRPVNLVVSVLYAFSVVAAMIGETWTYYILGSVVEILLLLAIAAVAWFWPVTPESVDAPETQKSSPLLGDPSKSGGPTPLAHRGSR